MPGGHTGLIPSIEEIPRPPSEQGTSSLPGLATDNIGYQTASSGSDEAATGLLERYSGGHTQDHTVEYTHNTSLKPRQPPASPPGAPTAVARGLTMAHLRGRSPTKPLSRGRSLSPSVLSPKLRMEQPAPALRNMGRIRSLREPSLSPNQQTGSYGSPSPSLGSEIDYPHATFRPRLADLWSDDPTPPPHVAATAADDGSATGARQSGPVSSASAEGRQAILSNPVFVRMSDQQNSSRPTGADFSSPFGPVRPPLAELPPPYDFQSAVHDAVASDAVVRPPGPATALGRTIAAESTRRPPTPAYAADYATVRTAVNVRTFPGPSSDPARAKPKLCQLNFGTK